MKCSEIVTHLMRYLPRLTDYFSEYRAPSSVSVSGDTVTINMPSHGLIDGQPVCVSNSAVRNLVSNMSTVSDGVTMTTAVMHNLTNGWYQSSTVELRSVSAPSIDGTYNIVRVDSNGSFTIDSFPDTGLVDVYVYEPIDYGIDGLFNITRLSDDSFSYTLDFGEDIAPGFTLDVVASTVRVHTELRITGTNDIQRALKSYEKAGADKLWLYVELGGFFPSKSNRAQTDATNEQPGAPTWMLPLTQPFGVYAVIPCNETTGRRARDLFEESIRYSIYKSLFGAKFESGLSAPLLSAVTPEEDGDPIYNVAYYVHNLNFSQTARITNDDRLFSDRTTPFRSIDIDFYSEDLDNDNVIMEMSADLDSQES